MPSVLLVADRPGWAYDILAQVLKEYMVEWAVEIQYIVDIRENVDAIDLSRFDVVFFFLWFDANRYGPKLRGFDYQRTCVGVHSIASWGKRGLSAVEAAKVCNKFGATGVISKQLRGTLNLDRPFLTANGVDATLFAPVPLPPTNPLRLMWVGNPSVHHHGDNKGFQSIIAPVVASLAGRVELLTATPEHPVQRADMGAFYAKGHVILCMSEHEGGPLPVIEAMHVGRPAISTSVGVVPEVIRTDVNGWIVDRSIAALRTQILALLDDPTCLEEMGAAAHEAVRDRTGVGMAASYDEMFRSVLKG